MTRDILEINDFVVLIEESFSHLPEVEKCSFDKPVICFSFYGSGNVELDVNFGNNSKSYVNTKGLSISFSANKDVEFVHKISKGQPMRCICVFSTASNLLKRPAYEVEIFAAHIKGLLHPEDIYVEGPSFHMTPEMLDAVDKIFSTKYQDATRLMFIRSQIMELLSHFFAIAANPGHTKKIENTDKLYQAKEILLNNMDAPPTLHELSRQIGLNSFKLKKNFKEFFGVPVFKFLQDERMNKAYKMLSGTDKNVQEVAFFVGYESLSSFSSTFLKRFGVRPSEIKR